MAEANKCAKYSELRQDYIFSLVAFETLGGAGKLTTVLLKSIGSRLRQMTDSKTAFTHFKQMLSLSIQRGNVASVLGTFRQPTPRDSGSDEQSHLYSY